MTSYVLHRTTSTLPVKKCYIYITKLFIVINVINEPPANLETITFTFPVSANIKKSVNNY